MFRGCKLNTASVQNIANTIKNINYPLYAGESIHIGIANSTPNAEETAAFNTIVSKGWIVYVNGSSSAYTPATATLDELGEEQTSTPIPYYAKPVEVTKEEAKYVDENGKFFNIMGGQFIYGDDLSTYGMFTCEEEAAANMRLTKYERPEVEKTGTTEEKETKEKTNPLLELKNVLKSDLTAE
jgi:hypothetical protein